MLWFVTFTKGELLLKLIKFYTPKIEDCNSNMLQREVGENILHGMLTDFGIMSLVSAIHTMKITVYTQNSVVTFSHDIHSYCRDLS